MKILVVGASGATGRLVVQQLLEKQHYVNVVVRSTPKFTAFIGENQPKLTIVEASLLDLSEQQMLEITKDCDAIISCLGHNLSLKGIFGHPRRLVTKAVKRLSTAAQSSNNQRVIKYVLMNTTGNRNRDLNEKISFAQKCVITMLRLLIPPHADNEEAADYLRCQQSKNPHLPWVVVRPDGLTDEAQITNYVVYPSPTRSAIFQAGKTSRINVAKFMVELVTKEEKWKLWQGQMPVIYNKDSDDLFKASNN